jgi:hypothetical protein
MLRTIVLASFVLSTLTLTGCSSYATPGRAADLRLLGVTPETRRAQTDSSIQSALDKKPLAAFPTAIAVARVQAPNYRSLTAEGYGTGRYSVVTTRDIETDDAVERLNKLPMTLGTAPLSRLLLTPHLQSDLELRNAAARLHADVLLIYTLDTTFTTDDHAIPLTLVSLGIAPTKRVRVTTTASAVLMDTRNGYVYGVAESTARDSAGTSAWQSETTADQTRRDTEREAFTRLVGQVEQTWRNVLTQYVPKQQAVTAQK